MKILIHDVETRSPVKLQDAGAYAYAAAKGFALLEFSYSIDGGPVKVVEVACGEEIPPEVLEAFLDPAVEKHSFNAAFERIVMSRYLKDLGYDIGGEYLPPESWRCDMVHALYCGLPMSLMEVGKVLGLPVQKEDVGKALIRKYCIPKKDGTFNELIDNPEDRILMRGYNKTDVETELALQERLKNYPVPDSVWHEYAIDQRINDLGIRVDTDLAKQAVILNEKAKSEALDRMAQLTGLDNPNSVIQLRKWLEGRGIVTDTIGKDKLNEFLRDETIPEDVKEVSRLRQVCGKSSTKKYETMITALCPDGRVHGMFQYLGAKTGRWSGRLLQLHNLPRNAIHGDELYAARALAKAGDYETMSFLYPSVPQVLSELIRTAFIPKDGYKFVVSDYSSVEARIIAYLANESWRNEVFESSEGADIYCISAEQIYGVPVKKGGVNGHLRARGKICELALGYGGAEGAIRAFDKEGAIPEDELAAIVKKWREASPNITAFWWAVGDAAMDAVRFKTIRTVPCAGGKCEVVFEYRSGVLFMTLPSGRNIAYAHPSLVENRFGGASLQYYGMGTGHRWQAIETYGPRLVENIVQAVARDALAHAMELLYKDYRIVMHIHDELVVECPIDTPMEIISKTMDTTPPWAPGLVLKSEPFECNFYQKD